MRRLVPVVLVLVAALLAFLFFSRSLFVSDPDSPKARVVVPLAGGGGDAAGAGQAGSSFLPLSDDETLISTVEADVDDDGFEDQISVLRTAGSPTLSIVVGLYSEEAQGYVRSLTIPTEISQVRTFACTVMDVVGDHTNALVYQGVGDGGRFVLRIYRAEREGGKFGMRLVGDFDSGGTAFVQQSQRGEAYQLSRGAGESFPVWVYESAEGAGERTDQLQTMYDWSPSERRYVQVRSLRVPGSTLAAKELARVQDGTVASFARFLDGLWYKNDGSEDRRYIFFDWSNSEIIFQHEDVEEVYSWSNSAVSRGGIYFSSVNKSIENLQRRFDISLVSLDEIRVRIQDDVRMLIGEENLWDGGYKKVVAPTRRNANREGVSEFVERLVAEEEWESADGVRVGFSGSEYTAAGAGVEDHGRYTQIDMFGRTFIQFRSEGEVAFFTGEYQTAEKDGSVVLQKVSVSPEGYYVEQVQPVVLRKFVDESARPVEVAVAEEEPEGDFQTQSAVSQVVKADGGVSDLPVPTASLRISPRYFSPDGDGSGDELTVLTDVHSEAAIKSWSFTVKHPDGRRVFWRKEGKGSVDSRIVWNGRSASGELVQSATDYPYEFTLTDANGTKCTEEGFVQVDILVIREGGKLKIQVPSIIFRSDNADFMSDADVRASPNWDKESRGLDSRTIENNVRVLSRVAKILGKFRDYRVSIEGHANNMTGTPQEEQEVRQLSEERARFVLDWLVREGISADRLTATGIGGKDMLVPAHDAANRWKNRRVEFILIK